MLAGGEHREIELMPYTKRKEIGEREMSPEEETAAVRRAFLKR